MHWLWSFLVTKFMALLGQFLTESFVRFFKYSLNFQGHAQKFERNKVWHANFIEFKYDRTNPQKEWAFEKTNKQCFYLHFAKSNFIVIFSHFIFNTKISYLEATQNLPNMGGESCTVLRLRLMRKLAMSHKAWYMSFI